MRTELGLVAALLAAAGVAWWSTADRMAEMDAGPGYLLVWSVVGVGAYGLFELGKSLFAGSLAWHSGGRLLAAGVPGSPASPHMMKTMG